ncbi:MAG: DUF5615 family PIN-like protein [Candidatus Sumerlaeia bacterium]|nr:DUF5615 family PIN-like protein [Candidatus Sumerlaeia bacterium]
MRLLADVNVEDAMIQWLRDRGHDVMLAREGYARAADMDLLVIAVESRRVIITRDKDFGELVFRNAQQAIGVILVRLRAHNQSERLQLLKPFWPSIEAAAIGSLVVVSNDRLRIKPLAGSFPDRG